MPVENYTGSGELTVGTAFELHLGGVPLRRGIMVNDVLKLVWFQNISVRRVAGESQDLKPLDFNLDEQTFSQVKIVPVPAPFEGWLKKVPAPVRALCAHPRKRPGPKGKGTVDNGFIHPERTTSVADARSAGLGDPGCSPPVTPPLRDPSSRPAPMASQLAEVRLVLTEIKETVDRVHRIARKTRDKVDKLIGKR